MFVLFSNNMFDEYTFNNILKCVSEDELLKWRSVNRASRSVIDKRIYDATGLQHFRLWVILLYNDKGVRGVYDYVTDLILQLSTHNYYDRTSWRFDIRVQHLSNIIDIMLYIGDFKTCKCILDYIRNGLITYRGILPYYARHELWTHTIKAAYMKKRFDVIDMMIDRDAYYSIDSNVICHATYVAFQNNELKLSTRIITECSYYHLVYAVNQDDVSYKDYVLSMVKWNGDTVGALNRQITWELNAKNYDKIKEIIKTGMPDLSQVLNHICKHKYDNDEKIAHLFKTLKEHLAQKNYIKCGNCGCSLKDHRV